MTMKCTGCAQPLKQGERVHKRFPNQTIEHTPHSFQPAGCEIQIDHYHDTCVDKAFPPRGRELGWNRVTA